jgi:uncharacterized protein YidB (DUF937 family)
MGLLDGILGSAVSAMLTGGSTPSSRSQLDSALGGLGLGSTGSGASTGLLMSLMGLLQQNGGLTRVLGMFQQSGLGSQADSWVGTGANMAVSGDHVEQVFGASSIGSIASQLGLSQGQPSSAIAQLLPELVNQMTLQGRIPDDHQDLLSQGLAMLRGGTS